MNSNVTYYASSEHFIIENFEYSFEQSEKNSHNETISFKSKQFEKEDFHNKTISFATFRNNEINE